jgi:hypothetical protein
MKLSTVLAQREALLRQTYLANLGFAYARLAEFGGRLTRSGLRGPAHHGYSAPEEERGWATLAVEGFSPSVIEEHFTDEDLIELADFLDFVTPQKTLDFTFRIEEFGERFLIPLRRDLEEAGISLDAPPTLATSQREPRSLS